MALSKGKRQLAELLIAAGVTKFPEGANWAAQDVNGVGFYSGGKPYWDSTHHEWASNGDNGNCVGVQTLKSCVKNNHCIALSRDEFDHVVAESDGWIEFDGTERPSGYFNKMIDVKLQDGRVMTDSSGRFEWDTCGPSRIVAYRLHKPEQCRPAEASVAVGARCKVTSAADQRFIGALGVVTQIDKEGSDFKYQVKLDSGEITWVYDAAPCSSATPTFDQLLQDWRNAADYATRKQVEADEAAALRDQRWQAVQERAMLLDVNVTSVRCDD